MELLGAFLTGVVGPVLYLLISRYLQKQKEKNRDLVKENIQGVSLISDELEEIRDEFNGDRVWISQFHNGGNFYPTGKSIQKFSICYELVNINTPRVQQTFQSIPVSLFPRVLSKIYKDGEIEILIAESEENSFGIDALTNQFKTKSISMIGLRSLDNHLIGVMGISYTQEHNVVQDEWDYIRKKSGVVGTLLSEYLYKTNKK
jgi:hypothetical protein